MNEALKYVKDVITKEGYDAEDDDMILEFLENTIHVEDYDERRWWIETFCVTELEGKLIGYGGARTTGDDSPYDKGWEFDPSSIHFVEKKVEMVEVVKYVGVS